MNVLDGVDLLLCYLHASGCSTSTVAIYRDQLKPFALWLQQRKLNDLRQVTTEHLQAYRKAVYRQALSSVTQGLRLRAAKRLFDHLVAEHRLLLNPAQGLMPAKQRQALPRPIPTQAEMALLLQAPDVTTPAGLRNRAWLELMYSSGLRIAELVRLDLGDLDQQACTALLRDTKTGDDRVVPFGWHAAHWLARYLNEVRPQLVIDLHQSAVFLTVTGERMRAHVVRESLHEYRQQVGSPRSSPRIACATPAAHICCSRARMCAPSKCYWATESW